MGKTEAKRRLDSISIRGQQPASSAEWTAVRDCRKWHADLETFIRDWNAIADRASVARLNSAWSRSDAARFILGWGRLLEQSGSTLVQLNTQRRVAERLFPYGIDFNVAFVAWDTRQIKTALATNFVRINAADAKRTREEISKLGRASEAPFYQAIREIADRIGDSAISDHLLAQSWKEVILHAQRLHGMRADFDKLDTAAEKIIRSGAPEWGRMVRSVPDDNFKVLPNSWRRTWEWACADAFVQRICDRERFKGLRAEQSRLEREEKRLFEEVDPAPNVLWLKDKNHGLCGCSVGSVRRRDLPVGSRNWQGSASVSADYPHRDC